MFKKLFISGAHNSHHPHLLRPKALLAFSFIGLFVFGGAVFNRYLILNSSLFATVYSSTLIDLANQNRQESELIKLKENPLLTKAAELKAADMASKGYFAHQSPEGITPWFWFDKAGYKYRYAGENLAVNFDDSVSVDKAWMNSPTHRANILNKNYTEIGIALSKGIYKGRDTVFVVQMFGSPKQDITLGTKLRANALDSIKFTLEKLSTNPSRVLYIIFTIIGFLVFIPLVFLFIKQIHRHHVTIGRDAVIFLALLLITLIIYELIS